MIELELLGKYKCDKCNIGFSGLHLEALVILMALMFFQVTHIQGQTPKSYNIFTDTLLVVNGKTITEDKIHIQRQELNANDTIKINQRGLTIERFGFQAIGLGQSIDLYTNSPKLTPEMINEVNNQQTKYKFIYLKDIILRTNDGRKVYPTTKTLKIVFIN